MRITHIAIWTKDLEGMKAFYKKYFSCTSSKKYINSPKGFESYFLNFNDSCKLELMKMDNIPNNLNNSVNQYLGLIHFAISVGSKDNVDKLTKTLRNDGYEIISNPRFTGDGYYESCILDPERNRIEITE